MVIESTSEALKPSAEALKPSAEALKPSAEALHFTVETLEETAQAAQKIVAQLSFPACIYLNGDMGAGKTTLTKYLLHHLGYQGTVTSPTYNLIQEYSVQQGCVYHMDLYRMDDPSEIEFLGVEDLWNSNSLFLIEWPQKGHGYLPKATAEISITTEQKEHRMFRQITFNI